MVRLANTAQGPLGCGSYTVRLINDGKVILEAKRITSVTWGRRADEKSTAVVTIPVQGTDLTACCGQINRIDTLRTEVEVSRNGTVVWLGWILDDVTFSRDFVVINAAVDIWGWTERRRLRQNHVHVGVDLTDIALDYLADINSAGDLPFVIVSSPTWILATRTVLAIEDKYASEPLKELLDSGLDITVVAGVLYIGPEAEPCSAIVLRDSDFDGDIQIKMDGRQRATNVVVKGANGIRAEYPLVQPDVCYHAADFVVTDEQILDQASADSRAVETYNRMSSSHPFYLEIPNGNTLSPSAPVHINALKPGLIVQFYSDVTCIDLSQAMRLVALDVEAAAGAELVRPTFEPVGENETIGI